MGNADLRIRIRGPRDPDGVYRVEAQAEDGSFYTGQMQLSQPTIDTLAISEQTENNREYGERLGQLLFTPQLAAAFQQACGRAGASGRVRIGLWISNECAELQAFDWERVFFDYNGVSESLACSPMTPFSRYTGLPRPEGQALISEGRLLRVLLAVANPTDLPPGYDPIAVEQELQSVVDVLGKIERVQLTILPGRTAADTAAFPHYNDLAVEWRKRFTVIEGPATVDVLKQNLVQQDIVHLLAHGRYDRKAGGSLLYLEDEKGSALPAPDTQIVELLTQLRPVPALLYLDSCEQSRHPEGDGRAFVGLGPKLVQAGFPAVVAMQKKVPMELANQLRRQFYRDLLDHGCVDLALNQSRGLLYDSGSADWSIPVLFLRVPNGQLFLPDPIRYALHQMMDSGAFKTSALAAELPLEAVVLKEQQLTTTRKRDDGTEETLTNLVPPDWKRIAERALSRYDLWRQLTAWTENDWPGQLLLTMGDRGPQKAALLYRLVCYLAAKSLAPEAKRTIFPVYVDLDGYSQARAVTTNRLTALVHSSVQRFWPEPLEVKRFLEYLRDDQVKFCILLNNGDDLPESERQQIIDQINDLAADYPAHQFVFSIEPDCWAVDRLQVSVLAAVQPLTRHRVEQFLHARSEPQMKELARQLSDRRLYDLASMPWLLLRMTDQAQKGTLPNSRTQVIRSLLDDEILEVPAERGQRARALDSLLALAREMQVTYRKALDPTNAFQTLVSVRGNREYNLEDLLDRLCDRRLLQQLPNGAVRFLYPCVQAYCCARLLADANDPGTWLVMTGCLGQQHRKWWSDVLILMAGLLPDPVALLERLVYNARLLDGEILFLAARYVQEMPPAFRVGAGAVVEQIVDALAWRSESANEPNPVLRAQAVTALGQFNRVAVVQRLASIASCRVRQTGAGRTDFEYGKVRQAAARALCRLPAELLPELQRISQQLAETVDAWRQEDVPRLIQILEDNCNDSTEAASLAGIAAFGLADLQFHEGAAEAIFRAFLCGHTDRDTRWSLADAMLSVSPARVLAELVKSGMQADASPTVDSELVLYLIAHLRTPLPEVVDYTKSFLTKEDATVYLKGRAIFALGLLNLQDWRPQLVKIALGDFTSIHVGGQLKPEEAEYLCQKALEALTEIGDARSVAELRAGRAAAPWSRRMDTIFYNAIEEIGIREHQNQWVLG
jgi:hypothetical protein